MRWHHAPMARRLLTWALVAPLAAGGALVAHALAYRMTGTAPGPAHAYLEHVPQVLAILATVGIVGLAFQQRSAGRHATWVFAAAAPFGFACQEHVERLAHTGELPWLLTTPAFLVGLALQVPVALLCLAVARRVAGTLRPARVARPPLVAAVWVPLAEYAETRPREAPRPRARGRAPPRLLAT
jgi:hypothetical protein